MVLNLNFMDLAKGAKISCSGVPAREGEKGTVKKTTGQLRGGLHLVFLDFGLGGRERRARPLLLGVVPHLLRKPRLRATPSTEQKISIEAVGIRTERDGTGAHRRAEGGSDGRVEEPPGQGRVEGVVPAAGRGERGVEGGRFGDQGRGQRAGMGRGGGGGGRGGGEDAAAEAAGGAPPPPHRSELLRFSVRVWRA